MGKCLSMFNNFSIMYLSENTEMGPNPWRPNGSFIEVLTGESIIAVTLLLGHQLVDNE